ncbi:MAG: sulfatase-like hydrolase/transferase, partial [Lentisphaerota bacterium]
MSSTEHNRTVTGLGRRDFLIGLGLATAGTAFGLSAGCSFLQTRKTATASGAVSAAKPNILIILPDQWRRQAFSCAGDPNVRTPNLDRLAGQGMSFERSYTVCPICGPARASLLTGRYPHQTDVWSHNAPY